MTEFISQVGFHIFIDQTLHDRYWMEWRKVMGKEESFYLIKTFTLENTWVFHNLGIMIKENYKKTFKILWIAIPTPQ